MGAVDVLRARTRKRAIEDHFVQRTLETGARDIISEQKRIESRYKVLRDIPEITRRTFRTTKNTLTVTHPIRQRFIDMKRIKGRRQKEVPIHNKPIYKGFGRMVSELTVGLTEDIRKLIANDYKIEL